MQLLQTHWHADYIHEQYGDTSFSAVYGAGCVDNPKLVLVFMNPTAKNVSAHPDRSWIRAPRLGFKQTRKMLYALWWIPEQLFMQTQALHTSLRQPDFAHNLYKELSNKGIYITNLAKCTQSDAKPLPNQVFRDSLPWFVHEMHCLWASALVTFGNQVSSIVCNTPINVSWYEDNQKCVVDLDNKTFDVYPCFYPVGMGYRNINKAIDRLKAVASVCNIS